MSAWNVKLSILRNRSFAYICKTNIGEVIKDAFAFTRRFRRGQISEGKNHLFFIKLSPGCLYLQNFN